MRKTMNSSRFKGWAIVLAIKSAVVLALLTAALAGLYMFAASDVFAIKRVEIRGNQHLPDSELMALMRVGRDDNLLMISGERVYDRLHSSPWIKRVSVRKELPGTLVVKVEETEPQALVRKRNAFVIVDNEGVELERIHGRPERFLPLISSFDTRETKEFREALRLASVINDAGIAKRAKSVEILGLDGDVKDLAVRIDGMEIKVGEGSYDKKLARLFELIEEIKNRPIKVDYIDLRFANRVIVKPVAEVIQ
jgi:cell division protein FtsQ